MIALVLNVVNVFDRIQAWLMSLWRRYGWGWAVAAAVLLAVGVWLVWLMASP